MKKTIVICASVSFYREVMDIKDQLEELGFSVIVPELAEEMRDTGNYDFLSHKEEYDRANPEVKKSFIDGHFKEIEKGDAVLIVNPVKHNIDGYIGPNVLMELTVGYYLKKDIFLLNALSETLPSFAEVMSLGPIVLHGNVSRITDYYLE